MTLDWLEARSPSPPEGLKIRMARELEGDARRGDAGDTSVAALGTAAVAALTRALSVGGTDREVAMDLLAADGLLTYACEAALEGEDPGSGLDTILSNFRDPVGS